MSNNNLILRTVNSPWTTPTADFTKNSVLSHTNVDNNFIYLRGELIYTAQTIGNTVTLKKINGNDLSFNVGSGGTSGGSVYWTSGSSGNYSIRVINDSSINATGDYSVAEGFNTTAIGIASHAEGANTTASGDGSHAEGLSNIATGDNSHVEGLSNIATGGNSHAEGEGTVASGNTSHAEGINTIAGGDYSHAEGNSSKATGSTSHAEGFYTIASGAYSHAEGGVTIASAARAHAEGVNTIASGVNSHAEGSGTLSSGNNSHSQNSSTISAGSSSHAGGNSSTASGSISFIHSYNSLVTGDRSAVLGGQNITGTTDDTVYVPNLNIGTIGGGTSVGNLGFDSNGNVVTGNTGNTGPDSITFEIFNTSPTSPDPYTIYDDGNIRLLFDEATTDDIEIVILTNPSTGPVHVVWSEPTAGTSGSANVNTASGQVPLNTEVSADDVVDFVIWAPEDATYPYYEAKVTVSNGSFTSIPAVARVSKWNTPS